MAVARDGIPATGSANGANSFTITLSTTDTNRVVYVGVNSSNNVATGPTVTSANLGTLTQVDTNSKGPSNGINALFVGFASSQLSSEVITVSWGGSAFPQTSGWAVGYSGSTTTGFTDAHNVASNGGANSLSTTFSTVTDGTLVIACIGAGNESLSVTANSGYSVITTKDSGGGFSRCVLLEATSATSPAGSVTPGVTFGGFEAVGICGAAIKPGSSFIPQSGQRIMQAVNRASVY